MLACHRTSLEEEFPIVGMDMFLNNKYMSDEESDEEHPTTNPISVLRPSYRSENVSYHLKIIFVIIYLIDDVFTSCH